MIVFSFSTIANLAEITRPNSIANFSEQSVVAIGPITARTAEGMDYASLFSQLSRLRRWWPRSRLLHKAGGEF
jgi:uroporphyrinogen-III synthase